jgi:hypothetical protein
VFTYGGMDVGTVMPHLAWIVYRNVEMEDGRTFNDLVTAHLGKIMVSWFGSVQLTEAGNVERCLMMVRPSRREGADIPPEKGHWWERVSLGLPAECVEETEFFYPAPSLFEESFRRELQVAGIGEPFGWAPATDFRAQLRKSSGVEPGK